VDKFIIRDEGYHMKVLGYVGSLPELVPLLAERRYALGITSLDLDAAAGLADGHVSKIECRSKRLGHVTLPTLLTSLGLKLAVVESDEPLPGAIVALLSSARRGHAKRPPVALPVGEATIPAPTAEPAPQPTPALLAA
jgi:hypothetical protein